MSEEEGLHLREYLSVVLKWRWLIIAIAVPITAVAFFQSYQIKSAYQATARILIERNTPNIVPFSDPGAINSLYIGDPQLIQTQITIIKSRAVIKGTLEKLGMMEQIAATSPVQIVPTSWYHRIFEAFRQFQADLPQYLGAPDPPTFSETAQAAIRDDQIVRNFLGLVTTTQVKETRVVDISVTYPDPEKAALLVNTLLATYIEQRLQAKADASRDAVSWLADELELAQTRLAETEKKLQAYREQYAIVSFQDRQNIATQKLAGLSEAANVARIKRLALETQYQEIQRRMPEEWDTLPVIINNALVQGLQTKRLTLETDYLELLRQFREKHPNVEALKTQMAGVQEQIVAETLRIVQSIANEYKLALAEEQTLTNAMEEQKVEVLEVNQKTAQLQILEKEVDSNRQIYNALLQRKNEASVTERLENTNIQIVDLAAIPTAPINARNQQLVLISLMMSLGVGIGIAFFLEYWNDRITVPEDLKRHLSIPFLGMIPKVMFANNKKMTKQGKSVMNAAVAKIVLSDPQSSAAEAYRGLRTYVSFSSLQGETTELTTGAVLLFTSSEPSEGKSSTVANLGITMAQSGQHTLIIDCDLRKPLMAKFFSLDENALGLADILADRERTDGIGLVIQSTDIENLDVIPCGAIPDNPSELLSLKKMEILMEKLRQRYDKILIDSPPINVVTDPVVLSSLVDGVVLVFHAGKTRRQVAQRAKEQLDDAGARILGGVINAVDVKKARYQYYYYYAYHYPRYYRKDKAEERRKQQMLSQHTEN